MPRQQRDQGSGRGSGDRRRQGQHRGGSERKLNDIRAAVRRDRQQQRRQQGR